MRSVIAAVVTLLFAAAGHAAQYADFYVVPVASHTSGAFGTFWMTDLAIQNFQSRPITVNLVLIESGEGNFQNVSAVGVPAVIPAGGSLALRDVLASQGKPEIAGAILVGADAPFAMTSRTYVTAAGGGTIGQTVPPARDFIENSLGDTTNATAVAYLPGLVNNTQFRTNLGFVAGTSNTSVGSMVIEVTMRDAAGAVLGTRTFEIPAGSFRHLQFSSRAVADRTFDVGSAEVKILAGDGALVTYASIVDNVSADSVLVLGEFPPNAAFASLGSRSVFRQLFDVFRSTK